MKNYSEELGTSISIISPSKSEVYIKDSTFHENHSTLSGSALYYSVSDRILTDPLTIEFLNQNLYIDNTIFTENSGNYVISLASTVANLNNVNFMDNE